MRPTTKNTATAHPQLAQMSQETADLNLAALLQAQRLLREDKAAAIVRLGLREDIADLLAGMSLADTIRLAASNFLCVHVPRDDLPLAH